MYEQTFPTFFTITYTPIDLGYNDLYRFETVHIEKSTIFIKKQKKI